MTKSLKQYAKSGFVNEMLEVLPMTASEFKILAAVSDENMKRLSLFLRCLEKWREKINLVSKAGLKDIWRRHFLDSAQLLGHIPAHAKTIVDLGSGAGFPGLVLAALGGFDVYLVESDARKCAFLSEANRLICAKAHVHNCRIEKVCTPKADIITARACAPLVKLLGYAYPLMKKGGKGLFLKGAKAEEELTESKKKWKMSVQSLPSISDSSGVILVVENISHHHG